HHSHAPATAATYTLSLHDALPISQAKQGDSIQFGTHIAAIASADSAPTAVARTARKWRRLSVSSPIFGRDVARQSPQAATERCPDRKSTRLNSSHRTISYAVFCLK